MIKLATWNVNSIKIRLEQILGWMIHQDIDILAVQETKTRDEHFPLQIFLDHGYYVSFCGQKSYNGVAIISRFPSEDVCTAVDYLQCEEKRIISVTIEGLRLINLYVPNGSSVGSEKYHYKLSWLNSVSAYIGAQLKLYPKLAVAGDFNIAPADLDVYDPALWQGSILVSDKEREAYRGLLSLGLHDSFRHINQDEQAFSWWDYRAHSFRRNLGLRIDHILLSSKLITSCSEIFIDKMPRKHERPSDHAPVVAILN